MLKNNQYRVYQSKRLEAVCRQGYPALRTSAQESVEATSLLAWLPDTLPHETTETALKKESFSVGEIGRALSRPEDEWVPYLLSRLHFHQIRNRETVPSFPSILDIEPTSVCNLKCIMCFQADDAFGRGRGIHGKMDFEMYKDIVDEAADRGVVAVTLASRGEPTLHPRISDMLRYLKDKGILERKINTNGFAVREHTVRAIVEADPTIVIISVDSHEASRYEEIRVGSEFEAVLGTIRQFVSEREKIGSSCSTVFRVAAVDLGQGDIEQARAFWLDLVDEFGIGEDDHFLDLYRKQSQQTNACRVFWERMFVAWNGKVNPCDNDYQLTLSKGAFASYGDLHEIWSGGAMEGMRQLHLQGRRSDLEACATCVSR